jgi:hypothetical protein
MSISGQRVTGTFMSVSTNVNKGYRSIECIYFKHQSVAVRCHSNYRQTFPINHESFWNTIQISFKKLILNCCLMACDVMWFGTNAALFRKNVPLTSSAYTSAPQQKKAAHLFRNFNAYLESTGRHNTHVFFIRVFIAAKTSDPNSLIK